MALSHNVLIRRGQRIIISRHSTKWNSSLKDASKSAILKLRNNPSRYPRESLACDTPLTRISMGQTVSPAQAFEKIRALTTTTESHIQCAFLDDWITYPCPQRY